MGFFPYALAIALGIVLAKIVIPLPAERSSLWERQAAR